MTMNATKFFLIDIFAFPKFYEVAMDTNEHISINRLIDDLLPHQPRHLYDPVRYILAQNGKKIRFNLTIKACELFSGNHRTALQAALAVEIFHNFTLIHDDIMDDAKTRRNQPTIHEKWDTNSGILSGDVMMILAYESLLQCPVHLQPSILPLFSKSARAVCEGQQMDMDFESLPVVQMDKYLEMITKKTAVLLAASLAIGAYCGNASADEASHLYEYGKNLGISFQIRDDLLDCYGEVQKVGKEKAGDIIQGKKTILYIRTWFSLGEEEQKKFTQLYHSSASGKIDEVLTYFDKAGAKEYALSKEQEYFEKALAALAKINLPSEQKKVLTDYTQSIFRRDH